jgi:hypothetical protein
MATVTDNSARVTEDPELHVDVAFILNLDPSGPLIAWHVFGITVAEETAPAH